MQCREGEGAPTGGWSAGGRGSCRAARFQFGRARLLPSRSAPIWEGEAPAEPLGSNLGGRGSCRAVRLRGSVALPMFGSAGASPSQCSAPRERRSPIPGHLGSFGHLAVATSCESLASASAFGGSDCVEKRPWLSKNIYVTGWMRSTYSGRVEKNPSRKGVAALPLFEGTAIIVPIVPASGCPTCPTRRERLFPVDTPPEGACPNGRCVLA